MKHALKIFSTSALFMAGLVQPLMAEESLLWKSLANTPAVVVPPYTGQPSPFPKVATTAIVTQTQVDLAAIEEQRRMRDKAYNYADQLIKTGKAMRPELRTLSVGGMVDGRLGPRVLVNNLWVGEGTKVPVRQVRAPEALEALKVLAEFDETASTELTQAMNAELATNPTAMLTVESIKPKALILKGKDGVTYPINFSIDSN